MRRQKSQTLSKAEKHKEKQKQLSEIERKKYIQTSSPSVTGQQKDLFRKLVVCLKHAHIAGEYGTHFIDFNHEKKVIHVIKVFHFLPVALRISVTP